MASPPLSPHPPTDAYPWALVGFGSGGRIFHAPLIRSTNSLRLAAVVTTAPERRALVGAHYPDVPCLDSIGAAAAAGAVGVTISTPPATHLPLALEAIAAGLHVVVDKPFALTLAETRRIKEAADEAGVLAIPYFNRRWDGDYAAVRAITASGRIGAVTRMESRLDRWRPVKDGWPSDESRGGGLLLDLGPHLVDQALHVLGPAQSVQATLSRLRPGAAADDAFVVTLMHLDGARSVLSASLAAPAPGPRFLVQGTAGGVRIDGFDGQEAQLKAGGSPLSLGDEWGTEPGRRAFVYQLDGSADPVTLGRGHWDWFYPAAASRIGTHLAGESRPPGVESNPDTREVYGLAVTDAELPTIADAVAVAAVLDAAREAAHTGDAVAVGTGAGTATDTSTGTGTATDTSTGTGAGTGASSPTSGAPDVGGHTGDH